MTTRTRVCATERYATHAARITGETLPTSRNRFESSVSRHVARTPGELIHGGTARVERKRNNNNNNNNNNARDGGSAADGQRTRVISVQFRAEDGRRIFSKKFSPSSFSKNGRRPAITPILLLRVYDNHYDSVNATKIVTHSRYLQYLQSTKSNILWAVRVQPK